MPKPIIIKNAQDAYAISCRFRDYFDKEDAEEIVLYYAAPPKTAAQLRGVHKLFDIIAKARNVSLDAVKEYCKSRFGLNTVIVGLEKEPVLICKSLGDYEKGEMMEFIGLVIAHFNTEHQLNLELRREYYD